MRTRAAVLVLVLAAACSTGSQPVQPASAPSSSPSPAGPHLENWTYSDSSHVMLVQWVRDEATISQCRIRLSYLVGGASRDEFSQAVCRGAISGNSARLEATYDDGSLSSSIVGGKTVELLARLEPDALVMTLPRGERIEVASELHEFRFVRGNPDGYEAATVDLERKARG